MNEFLKEFKDRGYFYQCTNENELSDLLNKEMLIGLAIVNPIYFFCMMIGAMKNLAVSISVILGTILGPVIYIFSSEWSLLFAGLIAGSVAFLFGEKNG